jgi:ubiquinone/menaquinone biosynthesis C-methylase UbiE
LHVISLDINPHLEPDFVGDVRHLPFEAGQFDVACAFEVLEHIPFSDFERSLQELSRVSKKNVIISLPILTRNIEFYLYLPIVHGLYFNINLPFFLKQKKTITDTDCHYWDVNRVGYTKKKILNIVKKYFVVKKQFRPRFNKSYWFLVLEKKGVDL